MINSRPIYWILNVTTEKYRNNRKYLTYLGKFRLKQKSKKLRKKLKM